MAPTATSAFLHADGFWGPVTAKMDWCERNYSVSFYVAEFWNALTGIFYVLAAARGIRQARKVNAETRRAMRMLNFCRKSACYRQSFPLFHWECLIERPLNCHMVVIRRLL